MLCQKLFAFQTAVVDSFPFIISPLNTVSDIFQVLHFVQKWFPNLMATPPHDIGNVNDPVDLFKRFY